MKKSLLLLFVLFFLCGCYKEKREYLEGAIDSYSDDFESYLHTDSLYGDDHWSGNQLTIPENAVSIDTQIVHSGNQSLCFFAKPKSGNTVSKASLLKNNFGFENNSVVEYEAWYYIQSQESLPDLFLVDFEDPAYISSSPGFRIMINENEEVCVERNKMNHHTLQQTIGTHKKFPKNQWVKLKIEFKLSQRKKGYVKIWQDDELILDHSNVITLAKDFAYASLGTVGFLRQIEIGITANGTAGDLVMYMDDFRIKKM